MRILTWAIRIALFILLVAFAAKNTDPVRLRFYFDLAWEAPLVALLLAFFAGGVALGIVAMLGANLAQRRELSRLEKKNEMLQAQKPSVVAQPPAAEG
jgi:lipopolysaccharide assembly protein A